MDDVRDILDLEGPPTPELTKESILSPQKQKRKPPSDRVWRRPVGMSRELFALMCAENKDGPPIFPTDTGHGYKQVKAQLGMRRPRSWVWTQFTNPARTDGAEFKHWRAVNDEEKYYSFAKFNKKVFIPTYTDDEYLEHLQCETWSRQETDHLFDLCRRFDLRFCVMQDRWDRSHFGERSIENLKERYYDVCNILGELHAAPGQSATPYIFDADHETRRKEQLKRLYDRTPEQVEEERTLLNELRKIESMKKKRERKLQELQKLSSGDNPAETRKTERKITKNKLLHRTRPRIDFQALETGGIKSPDMKGSNVYLRSSEMKLPANLTPRKMVIEQSLQELNIDVNPIPTKEICHHFNRLRSDLVQRNELRATVINYECKLQTLKHQFGALNPGKTLLMPSAISPESKAQDADSTMQGEICEIVDIVGSPGTSSVN